MTTENLHWIHDGLDAFSIVDNYTIRDAILRDRNTTNRYAIYKQIEGDEVHLHTTNDLDDALAYIHKDQTNAHQ